MNSLNENNSNSLSSLYPSSAKNTLSSINNSFSSISGLNTSSSSPSNGGFFSNISWITWIIIIIILTILGINIFSYLAEGTQFTANIVQTITTWFSNNVGNEIADTVKQTAHVSAVGVSATADSVANASEPDVNAQHATSSQNPDTVGIKPPVYPNTTVDNSLNNSLNNAIQEVQADDSYSSIQRSKGADKSGWCFIGEDKGIRSCVEVGPNDKCMSGDIFPTSAVCVNPNLRV